MSNRRATAKRELFDCPLTAAPVRVKQIKGSKPTPLRWRCHHRADGSDIEAWVPERNGLEIIAHTRRAQGIPAGANAEFIIEAVNSYAQARPLMVELLHALESCLEAGIRKWDAEQEADAVCRKVRRVITN